jgi:hypothetical protein
MGAAEMIVLEELAERRGQCTLLANVLMMTQRMLELAQAGDWAQVADMEQSRRAQLQECFQTPVAEAHSELFAEALAAMLHLNEELMALLEDAKLAVAERQLGQAKTRRGLGHYLDIEPLGDN